MKVIFLNFACINYVLHRERERERERERVTKTMKYWFLSFLIIFFWDKICFDSLFFIAGCGYGRSIETNPHQSLNSQPQTNIQHKRAYTPRSTVEMTFSPIFSLLFSQCSTQVWSWLHVDTNHLRIVNNSAFQGLSVKTIGKFNCKSTVKLLSSPSVSVVLAHVDANHLRIVNNCFSRP